MLRLQSPLPEGYSSATEEDLARRLAAAKRSLGSRLMILGHHYQRDEVMRWADARGDSFGLSRLAAEATDAEFVVFCGVHFMAESADILTSDRQQVILPDLNAGCSMADMADLDSVEEAWEALAEVTDIDTVVPITYMNSSAALKAFVGRHGGAVCTSSNARAVMTWALAQHGDATKLLFFPDQHLGRNTAFQLGFDGAEMAVWDPRRELGGLDERTVKETRFLLWKGHCSVHQRFTPAHVAAFRAAYPGGRVIAHPECSHEVVELADEVGSTDYIIAAVERAAAAVRATEAGAAVRATEAPAAVRATEAGAAVRATEAPAAVRATEAGAGTAVGIGTEIHLVQRLAHEYPELTVVSLDPLVCPCSTMFRIDAPHLCWVLEELVAGRVVNRIAVDDEVAGWARVALQRMLDIT